MQSTSVAVQTMIVDLMPSVTRSAELKNDVERENKRREREWESKMRKQKLPWGAINYSSCSFVSFALDLAFARGIKEQLGSEVRGGRGLIAQFCQLQMGERCRRFRLVIAAPLTK